MAYNFPNSPINGDTYLDYVWDTEKWILAVGGQPATAPPVPSNVYDPATGLAAPVTQVAVDVDALAASFAANTISVHGTNPAGTTFSATNWTSPSTSLKYATATNTYNFLFAGKYYSRDHTLTGWFRNGEVFLRLTSAGKAWVFQINHEGSGSLNILLCQGLAQGVTSPIRSSATETYYAYGGTSTLNADIAAKIPGFSASDTEGHQQRFEAIGLDLVFSYSLDGVSFTEIVRVTPLNSSTWLHMADGTVAIGNIVTYGWRDFTIDYNASPAALYSNFTTTLDVRDFGVKDVETTGSMAAGSPTLTVASAANLNIGDYVIVDTFGATGAGAPGGRGPGGQWPALRYADVTAMNADTSKPANTACSLTSTGDVWHFNGSIWERDATWNPNYVYMYKSHPMALRARIIGKSGLTLTLDANAVVAVTGSRVYHDNQPVLAFLADTQDFHVTVPPIALTLPDSRIVMGAAFIFQGHPGWSIRGAGSSRANSTPTGHTRLWAPLGCPGPEIDVTRYCDSVKDLHIDSGGYLAMPQVNAAGMAQDAYQVIWPHGLMFGLTSNISIDNLKITQVFQQAVGFRYCNNATVSNCTTRMTDPLGNYIQWNYQSANSTNITFIDCEMDSDWMMTFCEPFADDGTRYIRCIARNGISSNNTATNTQYTDLGVVMEAMSRYNYNSQHVQNPVLQSNSNIGPGSPSTMTVNRFRLLLEGYVDAANEQPKGIVLSSGAGSVVSNSNMEMLPYHASSTLNGAQGIVCDSSDCTISAVRVDGTTIGSWAGNITAYTGTGTDIVNCIADRQTNTQTGGTITGDQTTAAAGTDRIPTDVGFTMVTGAVVGQTYTSNEIVIFGVNALLQNVTLTSNAKLIWLGDGVVPPVGNGTVRDHDHWVRKILRNGDRLKLQAVAGAGVTSVVLQLASGKTYTWTITTDLYPDAVESAGAEDAWDLLTSGTGYRGGLTTLTSAPSGWTLTSTAITTNSASSSPLAGFDINGRQVVIRHSNATVRDNYVWVPADGTNRDAIRISTSENNLTNILIEYNTIDGKTGANASDPHQNMQGGITCHGSATGLANITIRGNRIMKTRDDGIKIRGANFLIEKNWISVGGMGEPAAHWDGIDVTNADSGGIIQDNMIDSTPNANSFGRTSGIAVWDVPDLIVRRNVIHYGANVLDESGAPGYYSTYSNYSGNAGIQFTNNVFEYGIAASYTAGAAPYGITAWTDNYRLSTGALITLPV